MDATYAQRCPSCDAESMLTSQNEYEVEHFGAVLISVAACDKCGYRHTDVLTLTEREPIALKARINSLEDLNMRVIKSGTATVTIPEFNASITPGPYSEGYITNVEGLLIKIEDALTFMLSTAKGKRLRKGERMLKQMRDARDAKPHFTLMIKDPFGNSAIISPYPSKVTKRKLSKRELAAVKFGQYVVPQQSPNMKS
ncbi:MAG TPA: ZPR1 zinc finger domain-containing protein [Terriglobales bacterium]|nr:ZPR1 zinc finger domain-containing protein [Terriglobales bacterium]